MANTSKTDIDKMSLKRNHGMYLGSSSQATTFLTLSSILTVMLPVPGPISSTVSVLRNADLKQPVFTQFQNLIVWRLFVKTQNGPMYFLSRLTYVTCKWNHVPIYIHIFCFITSNNLFVLSLKGQNVIFFKIKPYACTQNWGLYSKFET